MTPAAGAFRYRRGRLEAERVPLDRLAERFGTPLYVSSAAALEHAVANLRDAFREVSPLLCYAVKANPCAGILQRLRELGCGFDVVSGGELERVLRIGADPQRVVFEGAGKTAEELEAAVRAGILGIGIESAEEAGLLRAIARRLRRRPRVMLRLNPDVTAATHPYVATGRLRDKFGLSPAEARRVLRDLRGARDLVVAGLHVHIGSQIQSPAPYREALRALVDLLRTGRGLGHDLRWLDLGGGFGIDYDHASNPDPARFARAIVPRVRGLGVQLLLEPGRYVAGNASVLLTRVLYRKRRARRTCLVVDAAMNDLIRPALYRARHVVVPVRRGGRNGAARAAERGAEIVDVVGPICESGDFLALRRRLPPVAAGDLLAILSAGAYGSAMASNYNSRPRPAEVLVEGDAVRLLARRETPDDLVRREVLLPGAAKRLRGSRPGKPGKAQSARTSARRDRTEIRGPGPSPGEEGR